MPLLSDDWTLPIEAARYLLAELEARPVAAAMVDDMHARPGPLEALSESWGFAEPLTADEIDKEAALAHLVRKRKVLMALLRRSIETNEPLQCKL
jgi:hypothetical protein